MRDVWAWLLHRWSDIFAAVTTWLGQLNASQAAALAAVSAALISGYSVRKSAYRAARLASQTAIAVANAQADQARDLADIAWGRDQLLALYVDALVLLNQSDRWRQCLLGIETDKPNGEPASTADVEKLGARINMLAPDDLVYAWNRYEESDGRLQHFSRMSRESSTRAWRRSRGGRGQGIQDDDWFVESHYKAISALRGAIKDASKHLRRDNAEGPQSPPE